MNASVSLATSQRQKQSLSAGQRQFIELISKSLPELRAQIAAEMSANPAIEDVEHPLETPLSSVEAQRSEENDEPDFPDDDYEPTVGKDEEAAERRIAFFDNQVKEETLQEHLLQQLPLSDLPREDYPIVEVLVGDLDDKGYYKGSVADVAMAFGRSEEEITAILAKIRDFDPPGCGARDVKECLLSQLDSIENADVREVVRLIVSNHLGDILSGRISRIEQSLAVGRERFKEAVLALRSLDGRPGRQYPSERERVEFVNPEVHAVKENGRWIAVVDERSLPGIRISEKFKSLLEDSTQSDETKKYVKERIASAVAFREAVEKRRETIRQISQEIFDRQQPFFDKGLAALSPLTEVDVAKAVGLHPATVSRTVRDKYAETPFGTMELRKFFATAVKTASGEEVSQQSLLEKLSEIVDDEDVSEPYSDEKIAAILSSAGFPIKRRTVAKYRDKLGIPGASQRRVR